jgi:2-polyprenyl-3-methyl-5-hydroxy-6-metoxy-1,4-benzoquinol methylase
MQMNGIEPRRDGQSELNAIVAPWPNLARMIKVVLERWPEHAGYLRKSFAARSAGMMATSDHIAGSVLALAGNRSSKVADDYRWLGDRIREEEIEFARTGHYRYSSFEQTNAHVYSDDIFMERYMHGLLFSHVLWYMHASSLHFFRNRLEARVRRGGRVLEVGSGHGLLLYLALTDLGLAEAHAWDLSEISMSQTRSALALLGAEDRSHFAIRDMHSVKPEGETFDLIILSHILEHLENPVSALERMRPALGKNGFLFVNVPINAPMPDHVFLLETPDAALELLRSGGYRVVEMATHTTQAMTLSQALRHKTAVTCSIIAEAI